MILTDESSDSSMVTTGMRGAQRLMPRGISAHAFNDNIKKITFLLFLLFAFPAMSAETNGDSEVLGRTGLPLPRFASIRANEVNLRTGPGMRYPIEWVFVKQGIPVEIIAEFDVWRRVRDWEGTEGWVHKGALSGKRAAVITGATRDMLKSDDEKSPVAAHVDAGAVGQILSCEKVWCKVKFGGKKGYLHKTDFWGVYPNEVFD